METSRGFLVHLRNFICFLPYFIGLLLVGVLKGVIVARIVCVVMTIGSSAIVLGLWPAHAVWAYFCILSAKRLGPVMKLVMCVLIAPPLALWPVCAVVGSIIGGTAYGFLGPVFGTFKAVGEGKINKFRHCLIDGIWDTIKWSLTFIRDFTYVCLYSYFSMMDDLRKQDPPGGRIEIRLVYVPVAVLVGLLGFAVDFPVITVIAALKSPYMLVKGWHRLFHDCIGREGPFLEGICVPFAILLWPFAVAGALLGSMLASIFLGFYAAVIAYQESSFYLGLCYIVASLSIYDEYSNDILDMPEGSCFPKPRYRKNSGLQPGSRTSSFSRPVSFKNPPSRSSSFANPMVELKPLVKQIEELEELEDLVDLNSQINHFKTMPPIKCIWTFPLRNHLKLNTDGSSKGNPGPSSYGGLIRDCNGRWLRGYMGNISANGGTYTALHAELWSIVKGLCLIKDMNLSFVLIETDCQVAVRLVMVKRLKRNRPLKSVIDDIKQLMLEQRCTMVHTKRDGNHCADQLAKLGGKQSEESLLLEEPPEFLIPYLLRDIEAASKFERNRYHHG